MIHGAEEGEAASWGLSQACVAITWSSAMATLNLQQLPGKVAKAWSLIQQGPMGP